MPIEQITLACSLYAIFATARISADLPLGIWRALCQKGVDILDTILYYYSMVMMMILNKDKESSTSRNKMKEKEMKKEKKVEVIIAPTTLGRFKKQYLDLTNSMLAQKVDKAEIEARLDQRMSEDAIILGITLNDFKQRLAAIKAKSTGKLTENKELFRGTFNSLLDHLLYCINTTSDEKLEAALQGLLLYDTEYQSITGVVDSQRDDWRGLIVIAPFHADLTKLSRYTGGWYDGSKKERNQYSSGRRVPVAKSTGYVREQVLPE